MLGWGGTVPTEPKMETDLIKNVGVIFSTWTLSGALWPRRLVASSQFHCQLSFISTLSGLDICSDLHSVCCPDPRACYFLRGICAPASSYFGTRCLQLFLVHMVTVSPICCISANLWFTSAVAPAGYTSFFLNISQTLLVLSVLCLLGHCEHMIVCPASARVKRIDHISALIVGGATCDPHTVRLTADPL